MIAIVDSGSTKSSWLFTGKTPGEDFSVRTTGINPYYQTVEEIQEALQKELVPNLPQISLIKAVYFYGAGCELPAQQAVVARAISPLFNNCPVQVDSDLIAAARSVLGDEAGICCISGTGSNTCYYDGNKIIRNINSLGLYMGDEGSGGFLGKLLARDYIRESMPADIRARFEVFTADRKSDIMDKVYKKPFPNRYLASLAPFAILHKSESYINDLIEENFSLLFDNCICRYDNFDKLPVRFIGSIGLHLREALEKVAADKNVRIDKIVDDPMHGLKEYHLKHTV